VPAQGAAEVRIRLNPEELGPLEVQLKLDGDKLSLRFDLADERVKDLVQSSLPSLSSMLSARGLQLEQAQVFTQQRDGQGGTFQQPATPALHSPESSENDAEVSAAAVRRPMVRQGLLDDYA
jgi:flagellar hook-length control protein FliK